MSAPNPLVRDLVREVSRIVGVVASPDAAIVIRDMNGIFLFVNQIWRDRYGLDPVGKTIPQLGVLSVEEAQRSINEDQIVQERGFLVTIDTYHIDGQPSKMIVVRVLLTFHGTQFQIGVLYDMAASGMSSDNDDFQYASTDLLVFRLQGLGDL